LFERQALHLLLLGMLLACVGWLSRLPGLSSGSYLGVSTSVWLWWSISVPIVHQVWVWLCWRLELHHKALSRALDGWAFGLYGSGFVLAAFFRGYTLIGLGLANRGSLHLPAPLLRGAAVLLTVPALYLFYSVARYFTFKRALGADHFEASYRLAPLETRGIFKYTRNGMYIFGFLLVWLPGLLLASEAALLSAAFSHIYIWVHYYCTELPDMKRIYAGLQ